MSDVIISQRWLARGGTAADLAAVNETPKNRELILETDTGRLKRGDGVTPYNGLAYIGPGEIDFSGVGDTKVLAWDAANSRFVFAESSSGLHYRRDDLTASIGDDTITLDQAPYEDALAIHKDGALMPLADYSVDSGNDITLASPCTGGEVFSVAYWSTEAAGASTISGAGEVDLWESRIIALGGSVTPTERGYASDLIAAIRGSTYNSKIVYLLPFIGESIAAHRVPLRDTLNIGAALNTGFVDADCTTSGGIENPTEASKILNTQIAPGELGISNSGGMGFWERDIGLGTGVEPMGCYPAGDNARRFVLDLRSSMQRFRWGATTGSEAGPGTTASSAHYYGQRSSATLRRIYKDGTALSPDGTSSDAATNAGLSDIRVMGCVTHTGALSYWKGRCAVAYLTDGTMSDTDVSDFHTLLDTYLITPTGR